MPVRAILVLVITVFSPVSAAPPVTSAIHANYYRMKKVAIVDEHGFERPMPAMSLLIPADWQFQGNVQYHPNTACHPDMVQLAFRATSPDGRFAIEMFPITTGNGRGIHKWCVCCRRRTSKWRSMDGNPAT